MNTQDLKSQALADCLEIDLEEIRASEYDDNLFEISARKTKRGHSPSYYIQTVKEFKDLLTATDSIFRMVKYRINYFINNVDGKSRQERGSKLYKKLEKYIPKEPVIKDWFYNTNILFWLLQGEGETHEIIVKAWKGEEIKDERPLEDTNDGEYLVLTDEEREERLEVYTQSLLDDCILPEISEEARQYFDEDAWKADNEPSYGEALASYDGEECEQEIDGQTFYIYRTN